jgi:hypothetical protein
MAKDTTTKPKDSSTLSDDELRSQGKTTLDELEAKNAGKPAAQPAPAPEAPPVEAPPKDEPAQPPEPAAAAAPTPLAHAEADAQKKADEGQPDPLAQSKITGAAGAHGDLASELAKLPAIPALDGLKANAAYYRTVGKDELISALKGLPFVDEGARTQRDWLVQRAESGEFSRG